MKIFIDFYVLGINDYDVVIGIQWLKLLGQIVWDLNNLKMSFTWQQKTLILHGLHSGITTLISGRKLGEMLALLGALSLLEIQGGLTLTKSYQTKEEQGQLTDLLNTFEDLFTVPTGLPPARSCDHQIKLIDEKTLSEQDHIYILTSKRLRLENRWQTCSTRAL